MNICCCGCKTQIKELRSDGLPQRYVIGHFNKGKSNFWKIKAIVKKRTSHERAVKLCVKEKCFYQNEQCSQHLEIAHKDGNPFNNNISNLVCLCGSHHRLMDFGGIIFKDLGKIRPFYISSNKRRYIKA